MLLYTRAAAQAKAKVAPMASKAFLPVSITLAPPVNTGIDDEADALALALPEPEVTGPVMFVSYRPP